MAIYKAVLEGHYFGQAVDNILYYRNAGLDLGGLVLGGARECAEAVAAMIWPALKNVMSTNYELTQITVYKYDEQEFNLVYANPFTLGVQENGVEGAQYNGPATCAILKFILESHLVVANGPKPPKRGYLAIGPLSDPMINNDGTLKLDGVYSVSWNALTAVMGNNIETILPIPAVFFPVRVHQDVVGILGKLKITSFSDVQACVMRVNTSFRRSRMPE